MSHTMKIFLFSEFIYLLLKCLHSLFNLQKVRLLPQRGAQVLPVLPSEENDVDSPATSILYRPSKGLSVPSGTIANPIKAIELYTPAHVRLILQNLD